MRPPHKGKAVPVLDAEPRRPPFSSNLGNTLDAAAAKSLASNCDLRPVRDAGWRRPALRLRLLASTCYEGQFSSSEHGGATQSSSQLRIIVEGVGH
jgi:hypothetical protein